jgi:hypothetical protein
MRLKHIRSVSAAGGVDKVPGVSMTPDGFAQWRQFLTE